jgi:hypothetical protein
VLKLEEELCRQNSNDCGSVNSRKRPIVVNAAKVNARARRFHTPFSVKFSAFLADSCTSKPPLNIFADPELTEAWPRRLKIHTEYHMLAVARPVNATVRRNYLQ